MSAELFVRFTHFLAIFMLAGTLITQNLLLSKQVNKATLRKLFIVDAIYGASAVLVLLAGLTLWFGVGKPAAFYSGNPVFHAKLGLFVLVGLLSIIPTAFFMRHRSSSAAQITVPTRVIRIKRMELVLLMFLPLLAVLMARGLGW